MAILPELRGSYGVREVFGLNEEEEKEIEKFYEKNSRTGGKNEHNSRI